MRRFFAGLLIIMMLGTVCTGEELPLDGLSAETLSVSESPEALEPDPNVDEVSADLVPPVANATLKVDLQALEDQAAKLESDGRSEEAETLRKQIADYRDALDATKSAIEESAEGGTAGTMKVSLEDLRQQAWKLEADAQKAEAEGDKATADLKRTQAAQLEEQIAAYEEIGGDSGVFSSAVVTVDYPDAVKLGVGESLKLPGIGVEFKSSKPKYASVDSDGTLKGLKVGKAVITAKASGAKAVKINVQVLKAPSKVKLSDKSLILCLGDQKKLKASLPKKTASAITFTSSKTGVASVDGEGRVTALKAGKTTVTAKTFNGKKATCKVTVLDGTAPKKLSVKKTLKVGLYGKATLSPSVGSGAAAVYSYSVKNKKIASVSAKGVVTGKKTGSTVITVKTHNGLKATVKVTVVKKALTELTDLIGVDFMTAVKRMGGKEKDVTKDGKEGYENSVYRKNGYTLSAPWDDALYKGDKYYRKVNWILLEQANKYTVLGIKPGFTVEQAQKKLKAAGFDEGSEMYGTFLASTEDASFMSYVENGKLTWIQYSVG
ncbi:MAG: Ig-like domain-containing protein [Clostridia bacterium]|nr:Ig-like domain-containing protein [Clostridia bacterium]